MGWPELLIILFFLAIIVVVIVVIVRLAAKKPSASTVSNQMSAGDLLKLHDLLEAGVITQEEFEEQKQKLVG